MNYFTSFQLKIMHFWRRNKKRILISIIILLGLSALNYIIKNRPTEIQAPSITYKPHVTVLDDKEVPQEYQEPISNLIDTYFNYCNHGEYENAYNIITNECKKAYYPTLEQFTAYIDEVFEKKEKIYYIQSYSIVDNVYIYNIRILDDILANGTTDGYYYYEEKLILKEENGEIKLSVGEFISQDNPDIAVEDEYMQIEIMEKLVDYETETYKIMIKNKTDDKYIVLADGSQNNEIKLDIGVRTENPTNTPIQIIVRPGSFAVKEIKFNKFYDNGHASQNIIFGAVRILNDYDYSEKTTEDVLNKAVKLYSMEIPIN